MSCFYDSDSMINDYAMILCNIFTFPYFMKVVLYGVRAIGQLICLSHFTRVLGDYKQVNNIENSLVHLSVWGLIFWGS